METNPSRLPAIESHPQRQKIIDALLNGESPQSIARWCNPKLNHTSIWRYRCKVLEPALKRALETSNVNGNNSLAVRDVTKGQVLEKVIDATAQAVADDPILRRVLNKYSNYDLMVGEAVKSKDFKGFAAVDRAETATMTLHAQLTGRLQQAGPTTNVQVVFASFQAQNTPKPEAIDVEVVDLTPVQPKG